MTQSISTDPNQFQTDVFDPVTGHVDPILSAESARIVLSEVNTVRVAGTSTIDVSATQAKRALAKKAFLTSR
jgi:hypothetical protein